MPGRGRRRLLAEQRPQRFPQAYGHPHHQEQGGTAPATRPYRPRQTDHAFHRRRPLALQKVFSLASSNTRPL
jgi:hypothetical protein